MWWSVSLQLRSVVSGLANTLGRWVTDNSSDFCLCLLVCGIRNDRCWEHLFKLQSYCLVERVVDFIQSIKSGLTVSKVLNVVLKVSKSCLFTSSEQIRKILFRHLLSLKTSVTERDRPWLSSEGRRISPYHQHLPQFHFAFCMANNIALTLIVFLPEVYLSPKHLFYVHYWLLHTRAHVRTSTHAHARKHTHTHMYIPYCSICSHKALSHLRRAPKNSDIIFGKINT